jgi:ammonium transporter, Amt family
MPNMTPIKRIRTWFGTTCATVMMLLAGVTLPLSAQEAAPAAAAAPTVEQRVTGLEAYMNNVDPVGSSVTGIAGPGHNAWIMACAALVLFMTLPGLALFYGGLVRTKNVLSIFAQCLGIAGLVTVMWFAFGYSLVFDGSNDNPFIGGLSKAFFEGVTSAPNTSYCYWVSENVFAMFQLMFAIITPALIVGAIAERMKFAALMTFVALWMIVVYFPLAHMVWGSTGYMNGVWNSAAKIGAIDFAGGTVVHMSSGWSALVLCLLLGKRKGFGKTPMPPHSMVMCAIGTGMLWFGWYGFNAGSALAADGIAANAFTTTTIAAATGCLVWGLLEWVIRKHASILGFCSGAVAGLVVITPAAGFVTPKAAFFMGILAAVVPYLACTTLKKKFGYDDSLDTFGIHGIGGTMGALLTGLFCDRTAEAAKSVNANLLSETYAVPNGLKDAVISGGVWKAQLSAMGLTIVLSIVATLVIAYIVKTVIGLRATPESEETGLDRTDHGERGYEF